eukprot:COSAG01_NODE_2429_length_7714_cov_4.250033_7_plen_49_part_00
MGEFARDRAGMGGPYKELIVHPHWTEDTEDPLVSHFNNSVLLGVALLW